MDETWKSDLEAWLAPFVSALRHKTRARMCPAYIAGLIAGGDRKSVQPMAARDGEVGSDQLHHFITSGAWDTAPLKKVLLAQADRMVGADDAWLIVDDTALPKKREHSVGVAPQYASSLGKTANWRSNGEEKYYVSNLPAATSLKKLAAAIKARWVCEQGHQQLKEELASSISKADPGQGYTDTH